MKDIAKRPLGLYLHFPFCVRKCRYCDFLSFSSDEMKRTAYLERLKQEILVRGQEYQDYNIETLFIGGGTPSLMKGAQLTELLETVRTAFDVLPDGEWTMECNPGTTDALTLRQYREAGINRLSFGLQSMNDDELRYLGRIHTAQQFWDNYQSAREAGFDNINIDLMSALPGQTIDSWVTTLRKTIALAPEHISAYSLIIEEGTPFWSLYGDDQAACTKNQKENYPSLPDEDTERKMYHLTKEILADKGYHRYEISNYARQGCECLHNLRYWKRKEYLGLGLGAASMVNNRRFSNSSDFQSYMNTFDDCQVEQLDQKAQMEEMMFLGLRCTEGVSDAAFIHHFGQSMWKVYDKVIRQYISEGFLVWNAQKGRLAFSEAGMDVSNWILSDFLL